MADKEELSGSGTEQRAVQPETGKSTARKQERAADLAELWLEVAALWPAAKGSLSEVRKPCVRPNCKACAEGRKHPVWLYSCVVAGRRKCVYVPKKRVAALQQALANGRQLEAVLARAGIAVIQSADEASDDDPAGGDR